MSSKLLFLMSLFICPFLLNAQVIAGELVPGTTITNPEINLLISTTETQDSAFLDIDNDGVEDLQVTLHCAFTAVDIPNSLSFEILDPAVFLCAGFYTDMMPEHVVPYIFGDTLNCNGMDTAWFSANLIPVASSGSFITYGEPQAEDIYFAYQKNGLTGWIKASYDLVDGGAPANNPISVNINELLVQSPVNVVEINGAKQYLSISPNPSSFGSVVIDSEVDVVSGDILIFNSLGQMIISQKVETFPYTLNTNKFSSGMYYLILKNDILSTGAKMLID